MNREEKFDLAMKLIKKAKMDLVEIDKELKEIECLSKHKKEKSLMH